jgi:HSP20 family protein
MVYRTTLTPLFTLRREMDRLFDDAFGTRAAAAPSTWSPAVDVHEDATAWTFEVDLPGVAPEQVEVTAEKGVLTISGEKRAERQEGEDANLRMVERVRGTFKRTFQLPDGAAEDRIEASFKHGVLTVRVPKAEIPAPRRIEVRTA